MIRALCLDLMGTLLYDPYKEALEAAGRRFADPASWAEFEKAAIDEAEFARRFFLHGDLAAFHRVRRAGYRFLPGMRALLDAVAGKVDRYVASNYPIWIEELREVFDLDSCCEGVWASHHLGVRKPDPEFYHRLLARIDHPAADCLFVDDQEDNCVAAEAAGMRAYHFDGAAGLARRLAAEGIDL